ncbi:MAG TPA: CPBP family intramembrane glutamic endopeptidase [Solirubrobacteraceae bacterium]|jgi:hypothetical protein|nr:CPBP family intramembrane glutamic endopeptidase [Solirubrobacteraceae bacterium]
MADLDGSEQPVPVLEIEDGPGPAPGLAPFAFDSDPSRSPTTPWPWWTAVVALLAALLLATVAAFVIDLPAAAFGVNISSEHLPAGLTDLDLLVQDAAFVIAAVYCAQIGRRAVRSWQFGLRAPVAGWQRAVGLMLLLGVAYFALSAGWSAIFHPKREKLLDELGTDQGTLLLIASAALTCVVAPVGEEFLFRGYIFTALRNWRGTLPAAILTGIVFGGVHAGTAPALDLVPLGFLGFGLCLLYRYTGSLYAPMVVHSLNNSFAFAELEHWTFWQGALLFVSSLALLRGLVLLFTSIGLIAPAAGVSAPAA